MPRDESPAYALRAQGNEELAASYYLALLTPGWEREDYSDHSPPNLP
jgi:hypothetical protein